jgi:hypothetical protein
MFPLRAFLSELKGDAALCSARAIDMILAEIDRELPPECRVATLEPSQVQSQSSPTESVQSQEGQGLGWIVGSRRGLTAALGLSKGYSRGLERYHKKGIIEFNEEGKEFAIRIPKDLARHEQVRAEISNRVRKPSSRTRSI